MSKIMAGPLFGFVVQLNWFIKGYLNYDEHSEVLTREYVAGIVSSTYGVNFSVDDAIRYMLKNGYSSDITSAIVRTSRCQVDYSCRSCNVHQKLAE